MEVKDEVLEGKDPGLLSLGGPRLSARPLCPGIASLYQPMPPEP